MVEDEAVNQAVLTRMLQHMGHRFELAHNGREALEMLRGPERFDGVLLDCLMPVMDGFETAQRIRAGEAGNPSMPLIAVTAAVRDQEVGRCYDVGMDHCLKKPIQAGELARALELFCGPEKAPAS